MIDRDLLIRAAQLAEQTRGALLEIREPRNLEDGLLELANQLHCAATLLEAVARSRDHSSDAR